MRFGLIGYGAWGRHHAAAIAKTPGVSLAAIACASEATAAAARADHPGVPVHLDYRALLKDSAIDAVDVVVPNHLHAEIGCAALTAGKDVLLEKPMATTVARLRSPPRRRRGERPRAEHRPRAAALQPVGRDQAPHRGGGDRRAALCPRHPLPLPVPAGERRLALRRGPGRLVDPRGAGALLRLRHVVLRALGRSPDRPRGGQRPRAGRGDGRQLLRHRALPGSPLRRHHPDLGRVRAPSHRRDRGQRGRHPHVVVGHHGPDPASGLRAEGPAARARQSAK